MPLSKDNINGVLNLRYIVTEIDKRKASACRSDRSRAGDGFAVVVNVDGEAYSFRFGVLVIEIETDQTIRCPRRFRNHGTVP